MRKLVRDCLWFVVGGVAGLLCAMIVVANGWLGA